MVQGNNQDSGQGGSVEEIRDEETEVSEVQSVDELSGSPGRNPDKDGLSSTVLESQEDSVELGGAVLDSLNNGSGPFTPELAMQQFVKDFRQAKKLYGQTLIRRLTGYDASYVQKNMNIPEFRRHLEDRLKQNIADLQDQGFLSREGVFTEDALELAAVSLAVSELDHLEAGGLVGPRSHDTRSFAPGRSSTRFFAGEPYRELSVHQSVKTALRRGQSSLRKEDLRVFDPSSDGRLEIVYALDTSGSMKGAKIAAAKRAGVALAYQGIRSGDSVGVVLFGKQVESSVAPTKDFSSLLRCLTRVRAGSETDLASALSEACDLFSSSSKNSKHVLLLTDALPTVGSDPVGAVLEAVGVAASRGVTVSVIGIGLDAQGEALAEQIVGIGRGRVLVAQDLDSLDVLVLSEYVSSRHA